MTTASTLPAVPAVVLKNPLLDGKGTLYVLFYIHGGNPHPRTKNFFCDGDMKKAIQMGQNHCTNMSMRFIRVEPFFSDLTAEEKRHSETTGS